MSEKSIDAWELVEQAGGSRHGRGAVDRYLAAREGLAQLQRAGLVESTGAGRFQPTGAAPPDPEAGNRVNDYSGTARAAADALAIQLGDES